MSSLHPLVVMTKMPGLEARKISDHEISQPSLCIAVADVGRCVAELPQIMRVATMCDFDVCGRGRGPVVLLGPTGISSR